MPAGSASRHSGSSNARLLIGLAFAFAVLWKTISPDYLSGDFFHYTLLTDIWLEYLSQGLAGLPDGTIAANRDSIGLLESPSGARDEVDLASTPALEALADFMAWFGYLIEAGIALAFLLPLPPPSSGSGMPFSSPSAWRPTPSSPLGASPGRC